jgi:hypothetical protein
MGPTRYQQKIHAGRWILGGLYQPREGSFSFLQTRGYVREECAEVFPSIARKMVILRAAASLNLCKN